MSSYLTKHGARVAERGMWMAEHPSIDRFWTKVDRHDGCWLWTAGRFISGRPCFWVDGRNVQAHRWILKRLKGPLGDLLACHTCDNILCVNPDHLYGGTTYDNARDRIERGDNRNMRPPPVVLGEDNAWSKLTADMVRLIRAEVCLGTTRGELVNRLGIKKSTFQDVLSRRTWGHVA